MTIRAVFRVQCDGPCRGWLSVPPELIGKDTPATALTVEPTAVHAGNWPGERAARIAALGAGWTRDRNDFSEPRRWLCPSCSVNPLGIVLPPWSCVDPGPGHAPNMDGVCAICGVTVVSDE